MEKGLTRLLRWVPVLLIAALVAVGCASSVSVDPNVRNFQKVGVISVAGTYFTQMKIGFTVFANDQLETDISELQLDRNYEVLVADGLRKTGLDAVPIATSPKFLTEMFRPSTLQHVAFDLDSQWSNVEEEFKAVAKSNNVDALVLLVPRTSGDYFAGTNQLLRGLGTYARSSIRKMHLISRLVVISGQTGKPIGHMPVSAVQPTTPGGPHQRGQPSIDIDSSLSGIPFSSMTIEQKARLRQTALMIPLGAAINATIPQLLPAR